MSGIKPEIVEMSIVVIGAFEPYYMVPSWFAHNGLFSEEEGKAGVIHYRDADFLHCSVDWVEIIIDRNRMQIRTKASPYIRLKDFVCKFLAEVVNSKPILQLGINYSAHFNIGFDGLEKLGKSLAPREPWGEWGRKVVNQSAEPKTRNGLLYLTMRQKSDLSDRKYGHIDARVETSKLIPNDAGAHVFLNDHFDFVGDDDAEKNSIQDADKALETIAGYFEISIARSEKIASDVINGVIK